VHFEDVNWLRLGSNNRLMLAVLQQMVQLLTF